MHDNRPQTDLDLPGHDPDKEGVLVKLSLSDALRDPNLRISRRRYANTSMREYLTQLTPPLNEVYTLFYDEHSYFSQVCAGARHHHWWLGGLQEHCREMIGICLDIKDLYRGDLDNHVTKDDIIIAVFLHDFAKIWRYELISEEERDRDNQREKSAYKEQQVFKETRDDFSIIDEESKTLLELSKYGITPTERQWSAVLFIEGMWAEAAWGPKGPSRTVGTVMGRNPLAILLQFADSYSCNILGGSIA